MSNLQSSGRGGAGNIVDASKSPKITPEDLETPTLHSAVVTTGRGGTGNMAKNTDPAETRARQDVEPVPRRDSVPTHVGRGGASNVYKPSPEEVEAAKKAQNESAVVDSTAATVAESAVEPSSSKKTTAAADKGEEKGKDGLVARGKQWLLGKK